MAGAPYWKRVGQRPSEPGVAIERDVRAAPLVQEAELGLAGVFDDDHPVERLGIGMLPERAVTPDDRERAARRDLRQLGEALRGVVRVEDGQEEVIGQRRHRFGTLAERRERRREEERLRRIVHPLRVVGRFEEHGVEPGLVGGDVGAARDRHRDVRREAIAEPFGVLVVEVDVVRARSVAREPRARCATGDGRSGIEPGGPSSGPAVPPGRARDVPGTRRVPPGARKTSIS